MLSPGVERISGANDRISRHRVHLRNFGEEESTGRDCSPGVWTCWLSICEIFFMVGRVLCLGEVWSLHCNLEGPHPSVS